MCVLFVFLVIGVFVSQGVVVSIFAMNIKQSSNLFQLRTSRSLRQKVISFISIQQYTIWVYQHILLPGVLANFGFGSISTVDKDYDLYQVFMYSFMRQIFLTLPTNNLFIKRRIHFLSLKCVAFFEFTAPSQKSVNIFYICPRSSSTKFFNKLNASDLLML